MTYEADRLEHSAETLLRVSQAVQGGLLRRLEGWMKTHGEATDPTASAALERDRARADHGRLFELITLAERTADELLAIAANNDSGDWCANCLLYGVRTPITRRSTGEVIYRRRCRPCGDRRALTGQEPSREWVLKRYGQAHKKAG